MEKAEILQQFVFKGEDGYEFPIQKPLMEDCWFCCLREGRITVNFNHKEYTITANRKQKIYFLINEGMFFSILSGSGNFHLQVIEIAHNCLTRCYAFLSSDANLQIVYTTLVTSKQMNSVAKNLFRSTFQQFELLISGCDTLKEYNTQTTSLIVFTFCSYANAISQWRKDQGLEDNGNLQSQTQSYQIMNNLSKLFDETDSIQHREVQYFANRLNISVRYFFNVCKQETGMSPKEFINDIIISDIKHTLLTTNLSLQQLTFKYAFSDQSALTQYFRRNTGLTPSEFRRQNLNSKQQEFE